MLYAQTDCYAAELSFLLNITVSSFAFILCWPKRAWLLLLWHSKYLWSLPQNFLSTSVGGPWSERNHGKPAINWIVGQSFCLQTQGWLVNWLSGKAGDKELLWNSVLRFSTIHLLEKVWCTWPLNDLNPAAQMCSGKQIFQVSFSYVCSFLTQRIPDNDFHKNWCYILCLSWISQREQPLLGFNSQVIVQNHVPRQKCVPKSCSKTPILSRIFFLWFFLFYFNTF